ncbi:sensor histidine kinase [uncultured Maribacter sp.]|uniref:sensor histidine kinase n=1 Tax=uncultured Maribacter sp. TaxID=431308 RepID=UPI00261F0761|nr:sensor histidine kinase [uncultured Maribacter sp.]
MKCLSDYLWQTLVPIVFFSFIWMLFSYLKKEEEVREIKEKNNEIELQFLKSQINPHVLFNNLNTIYSYALEEPKKVPEMVLMLSDNLKHVLYESNTTFVSLEKELDYVTNYIAFQKIRTQNIKTVIFKKNIDTLNYKIAPLLLITLIENSFKHSASKSTINIEINVENSVLRLGVTNKIAIHSSENLGVPIGLANLKKRLKLLYKDKHVLVIEVTENYSVQLKLELT